MFAKLLAVSLCVSLGACVFSQSDIDYLNTQSGYEVKLKQAKINCDARLRDQQDGFNQEREALRSTATSSSSQFKTCAASLQSVQTIQSSFFTRLSAILSAVPALRGRLPSGGFADLDSALRAIEEVVQGAGAAEKVEECKREVEGCRAEVTRLQSSTLTLQTTIETITSKGNDCQNRLIMIENSSGICTTQLNSLRRDFGVCEANLASSKKSVEEFTIRIQQTETYLSDCKQKSSSSSSDVGVLRGKLQFLFDLSGLCRQNFFALSGDKTAIYAALSDLSSFVGSMKALDAIPGGLQDKINVLASERASFRRRVELISVVLNSLFAKVDGYSAVLNADGYDGLLKGNGSGNYGGWIFNSATDGVDITNLSSLDSCRRVAATLQSKISTISSNLNIAIRNNNECLKKFNEGAAVTMIGSGIREDY